MEVTRKRTYLGAAAVLVVALVVGVTVAITTGGTSAKTLTHEQYAQLFANADVRRTKVGVLSDWPKPYQTYHDAFMNRCFEWWDNPIAIYSLCFDRTSGALVNKDIL